VAAPRLGRSGSSSAAKPAGRSCGRTVETPCLSHSPNLLPPTPHPPTAFKARIAQRGAIPPLIRMLGAPDTALREMAAFALGRLAQDSENQVGACPAGWVWGVQRALALQHNPASRQW
jgi:hypothetical protein